jgi:hypothetical protein
MFLQNSNVINNWLYLNNDELFDITGIRLTKLWKYNFTGFNQEYIVYRHKQDCILDFYGIEDNNCKCSPIEVLMITAYLKVHKCIRISEEVHNVDNNSFIYVKIREFKDEFSNPIQYQIPDLYPPVLIEGLENALCTIAEMMKVYEVTKKELDFGPPYKIGDAEVSNEVINNILYDKEDLSVSRSE